MSSSYDYHKKRLAEVEKRFLKEVAKHEMTILHDDGVYRHIRFANPDSSFYYFDLVTWPGYLHVGGDIEHYTFARLNDMFDFFTGPVNASYWGEKALNATITEYSEELFKKNVQEVWTEAAQYSGYPFDVKQRIWEAIKREVLDCSSDGMDEAMSAWANFRYYDESGPKIIDFEFSDVWEYDPRDYKFHFLFSLNAVKWGIEQYKAAKKIYAETPKEKK